MMSRIAYSMFLARAVTFMRATVKTCKATSGFPKNKASEEAELRNDVSDCCARLAMLLIAFSLTFYYCID